MKKKISLLLFCLAAITGCSKINNIYIDYDKYYLNIYGSEEEQYKTIKDNVSIPEKIGNNLVTLYSNIINEEKIEDAPECENDGFSFSYYFSCKMIGEVTNFFNLHPEKELIYFTFNTLNETDESYYKITSLNEENLTLLDEIRAELAKL